MKRLPCLLILAAVIFTHTAVSVCYAEIPLLKSLSSLKPEKTVLDNGLTVVLKDVPSTRLISIDIKVRAGSAHEGEFCGSGIAHFVEHMIFKGTDRRPPGQIDKEIKSLGGTINGATTFDYTTFIITVPNEHLSSALDILSDFLFKASMHPKEVEKERGVIRKEIKLNTDDPMRYISRLLWGSVFVTHSYKYPIIGYEALFLKLKREDLLKYYKKMYVPNNMVLALVGDFESEEALNEVKKYFGQIERNMLEDRPLSEENPQLSKRTTSVNRDLKLAYFAMGYPSVSVHSTDMPFLDILSSILGHGESSRLYSNIYRNKQLVYSIGSWNYTPNDPGVFIISGVTEPDKLKAALAVIREEINRIRVGTIDAAELDRVKAMLTAEYIYSLQTLADQARDLSTSEILTGDFDFTKRYLERLNIATADDVSRVARQYLSEEALSLVTLAPSKTRTGDDTRVKKAKSEIRKITLPNGLRCLVREDHTLPTVSMLTACLSGLRAEDENTAGISNLTGTMMLKGTASKTEEEVARLVENMGASLSFFSGNNTLGIKFDLLSKDLKTGLDLFAEIVTSPVFSEDVFEREKRSILAAIKATDDDIFESGIKEFKFALFRKHPYRFLPIGIDKSVNRLSTKDLRDFYANYFVPKNMIIVIFGDIDSAEITEFLKDRFSGLENTGTPKFTSIVEPQQTEPRQRSKTVKKEQSLVIMGFKGATIKSEDRDALQLISAALSGLSGRLAARLRERLGIAYTVGAYSAPAFDPGYFMLYIATTNDKIDEAKKEFIKQVNLLNKHGLTQEELDLTKKELIGNQRIALQTNSSLAYQTGLDELYGLPYNHYLEYGDIINSITNDKVVAVSRKYLKPDSFTLVVLKGERGG